MSEWKGPWKCDKCGRFLVPEIVKAFRFHYGLDFRECHGKLFPYDRRAPTDEYHRGVEAMRDAVPWHERAFKEQVKRIADRLLAEGKEGEK